jgi:hypothetical protein
MTATDDDHRRTVTVSVDRLECLERCEAQAALHAQQAQRLQARIDDLEAELKAERENGERNTEVLVRIARSCDDRVDEMKAQHAAVLHVSDDAISAVTADIEALRASHVAAIDSIETQHAAAMAALTAVNAALVVHAAALQAHAKSYLPDIHAACAALQTLEIHPARPDGRQFAEWHTGPVPVCGLVFDRHWCAAACRYSGRWNVDIDAATSRRALVTRKGETSRLTLRGTRPLPRPSARADGAEQDQLSAYRVVIEAYGEGERCDLGFLPSRHTRIGAGAASAVTPDAFSGIWSSGGWDISVFSSRVGDPEYVISAGWKALQLSQGTYATTTRVPPVPAGSAVEFSVDYAAGTCRVAFYTPAAVAGGFVEAPHAKMELRFVATPAVAWSGVPPRPIPTRADSGVELYPAVAAVDVGTIWRFVS